MKSHGLSGPRQRPSRRDRTGNKFVNICSKIQSKINFLEVYCHSHCSKKPPTPTQPAQRSEDDSQYYKHNLKRRESKGRRRHHYSMTDFITFLKQSNSVKIFLLSRNRKIKVTNDDTRKAGSVQRRVGANAINHPFHVTFPLSILALTLRVGFYCVWRRGWMDGGCCLPGGDDAVIDDSVLRVVSLISCCCAQRGLGLGTGSAD